MEADSESVSTFCSITGASADVASGFLSLSGNDVSRAIELFFENPDLAPNVQSGLTETTSAPPPVAGGRPSTTAGRQDASGVIHIDSDDDNDDDDNFMQIDDNSDNDDGRVAAAQAAAIAQEEEDAAMAKRLQEELYQDNQGGAGGSGNPFAEEDVRAPIARTTETLIAPGPAWAGSDDSHADSAILDQLRRRRMPPGRSGGPFSQQIWGGSSDAAAPVGETGSHARRLADLFRPPYDIIERGLSWDDARSLGKEDKKWIMVNLQDMNDFNCQALNRDIWKDEAVRDLVKNHFIFLQYDKDYPDAEEFMTFYFTNSSHENPDNYPHVSIIDPRTGEQVKVWSGRPFPSAPDFHAELAEFLDRYSLEVNSKNPVAKATAKKPQTVDVDRMTEDEMLEMALKNSMAGAAGSSGSSSTPNVHDPDSLTKSPLPGAAGGASRAESEAPAEQSPFAQIASTNPHTEPENNPATTTRIQFRHPTGRVIRRFNVQDPVRRIYEWLKAEPLEGKEGVVFELKKMPQGQDLLESVDTTIEENGLKQGTVMIEFIED